MSFRGSLVACLILATGCSLAINDPSPPKRPSNLTGGLEACLANYQETFRKYFAGSLEEGKAAELLDCFGSALSLFKENFRGDTTNSYGQEKLKAFLEKTFLKGETIDPVFFRQAMKLKQAVLGGTAEAIRSDEIDRTRALIAEIRGPVDRLRTIFPLNLDALRQRSRLQLLQDLAQLESTAETVGAVIGRSGQYYELADFFGLVESFLRLAYPNDRRADDLRAVLATGLVQRLKAVLVSNPPEALTPRDWGLVFPAAARLFSIAVKTDSLIQTDGGFGSADNREVLRGLLDSVIASLRSSVSSRVSSGISVSEISELLWDLHRNHWVALPESLGKTPEEFGRSVFVLWGSATHALTGRASRSLDLAVLDRVQVFFSATVQAIESVAPYLPFDDVRLRQLSPAQLGEATQALDEASLKLGGVFGDSSSGSVEFLELPAVVRLLAPKDLADKLEWPMVDALRRLVLPSSRAGVAPGDWGRLVGLGAQIYGLVMRAKYLEANDLTWSREPGLGIVEAAAHDAGGILQQILIGQQNARLSLERVGEFLKLLHTHGWVSLPESLVGDADRDTNILAISGLVGRLLGMDLSAGLTPHAVGGIGSMFDRWVLGHRSFLSASHSLVGRSVAPSEWVQALGDSELSLVIRRMGATYRGWGDGLARVGWLEGAISYPGALELSPAYVESVKNVSFLLMRMVDGFVVSGEARQKYSGMTLPELNDAYRYLEPVLASLGLLKPAALPITIADKNALAVAVCTYAHCGGMEKLEKIYPVATLNQPSPAIDLESLRELRESNDVNPGAMRRFREAVTFSPFSQPYLDPDQPNDGRKADPAMISVPAGVTYVLGWMGAVKEASEMFPSLTSAGLDLDAANPDGFKELLMQQEFVKKHWGKRHPELAAEIATLTDAERTKVGSSLAAIAFGADPKTYDLRGKLWVMNMVLQFVETLFARFDVAPKDGRVRLAEMEQAFPLFEAELRRILIEKRQNPNHARLLLGFLLAKGREPSPLEWLTWREESMRAVNGDRKLVIQVFGLLAAQKQ